MDSTSSASRRAVLTGAGAVVGVAITAGCSRAGENEADPYGGGAADATTGAGGAADAGGEAAGSAPLARLGEIPFGSAIAVEVDGKPVVIGHPGKGKAVAFSAVCTHQGCTVAPRGKELHCPCHGSVFDASTGEVIQGPATTPLPPFAVHVEGQQILPGA